MSLICTESNTSNAVIYDSRQNVIVCKNSFELLRVEKELCVYVREFAYTPVYLILRKHRSYFYLPD